MRNLIRNVSHNSRCAPRSTVNFAMNPPSPLGATISSAGIAALVTFATVSNLALQHRRRKAIVGRLYQLRKLSEFRECAANAYNKLARNSRVSDHSWRVSEAFTRWSSNFGLFVGGAGLSILASISR